MASGQWLGHLFPIAGFALKELAVRIGQTKKGALNKEHLLYLDLVGVAAITNQM